MMKTYPLFAYAKLKTHNPKAEQAIIRGELHLLPNGDGAADFSADGLIFGELLPMTHKEITRIDREELPEYQRRRVIANGKAAWAYELKDRDAMLASPIIKNGVWAPHMKR